MADAELIYVAGPYSAATLEGKIQNTYNAIDAALTVITKGHYPFVPHLTHWVDQRALEKGIDLGWEYYMEWDDVLLQKCDAILYLAPSTGANIELDNAKKRGIKIYYSVDEIPDVKNKAA